jgi:hypothetical protein
VCCNDCYYDAAVACILPHLAGLGTLCIPARSYQNGAAGFAARRAAGSRGTQFVRLIDFAARFEGAERKSRRFAEHYACVAEERGCAFLDTGRVIVSSDLDGIHLEASEQEKLGVAVAEKRGRSAIVPTARKDSSHWTVILAVMFRCYTIAAGG